MDDQDISIQPMAPVWQAAWLDFFDHVAFADNPRWARCYCQFPLRLRLQRPAAPAS